MYKNGKNSEVEQRCYRVYSSFQILNKIIENARIAKLHKKFIGLDQSNWQKYDSVA